MQDHVRKSTPLPFTVDTMNTLRVGTAVVVGVFILLGGMLLMTKSTNSQLRAQVETLNQQLQSADEDIHAISTRSENCEKEVS